MHTIGCWFWVLGMSACKCQQLLFHGGTCSYYGNGWSPDDIQLNLSCVTDQCSACVCRQNVWHQSSLLMIVLALMLHSWEPIASKVLQCENINCQFDQKVYSVRRSACVGKELQSVHLPSKTVPLLLLDMYKQRCLINFYMKGQFNNA